MSLIMYDAVNIQNRYVLLIPLVSHGVKAEDPTQEEVKANISSLILAFELPTALVT